MKKQKSLLVPKASIYDINIKTFHNINLTQNYNIYFLQ